jgi:hypothetical protein
MWGVAMPSNRRFIFFLVLLICLVVGAAVFLMADSRAPKTPAAESQTTELPKSVLSAKDESVPDVAVTGELTGTVISNAGEPLAGPKLRIKSIAAMERSDSEPFLQDAVCNDKGEFALRPVPVGRRLGLIITHEGMFTVVPIELTQDRPKQNVTIKLQPSTHLAGHVRNSKGEPVSGATVSAYTGEDMDDMPYQFEGDLIVATSGADGAFKITHVWPARIKLAAKAEGYAQTVSGLVEPGSENIELVVSKGGSATGTVVDAETGSPLAGITLSFVPDDPARMPGRLDEHTAQSKDDGSFSVAGLRAGKQLVQLNGDKRIIVEGESIEVHDDEESTGITIKVGQGGSISGRVTNADSGLPVSKISVSAIPSTPGPIKPGSATTDSDGRYSIGGLRGGSFVISAQPPRGYVAQTREERPSVAVTAGKPVEGIDIKLKPSITIAGIVKDPDGKPVAEAQITAKSDAGGEWPRAISDEEGHFQITGLDRVQTFHIQAQKEGYSPAQAGPLDPAGEAIKNEIELVLQQSATITGIVVNSNGKPLEGMRVIAVGATRNQFEVPNAQTDWTGMFEIQGLADGEYALQVTGSARKSNVQAVDPVKVTVKAGETVKDVKLVFDRLGDYTIAGRTVDAKNSPVKNVNLSLSGNGLFDTAASDESGYFEFSGLLEGKYTINAKEPSHSPATMIDVEAGKLDVTITLEGVASVEGQVVDNKSGEPVREFSIRQVTRGGGLLTPTGAGTTYQDPEGRFRLDGLPRGNVTLSVRAKGYVAATHTVKGLTPDEERSGIRIDLLGGASVTGHVVSYDGAAVAGALIFADALPFEPDRKEGSVAETDANGTFSASGIQPGAATLWATHPQFAAGKVEFSADAAATTDVQIVLTQGGSIRGQVTARGQPAAGASMRAMSIPALIPISFKQESDGTFFATGVAASLVEVTANLASGTQGRTRSQRLLVNAGETVEANFEFSDGEAALQGTVTLSGAPAKGLVQFSGGAPGEGSSWTCKLDENGAYSFDGVDAGAGRLTVTALSPEQLKISRTQTVELIAGNTTTLDVSFDSGAIISGRVAGSTGGDIFLALLPSAIPLPSPLTAANVVEFSQEIQGEITAEVRADSRTGDFSFQGIQPGDYTILAWELPADVKGPQQALELARLATSSVHVDGNEPVTATVVFAN